MTSGSAAHFTLLPGPTHGHGGHLPSAQHFFASSCNVTCLLSMERHTKAKEGPHEGKWEPLCVGLANHELGLVVSTYLVFVIQRKRRGREGG